MTGLCPPVLCLCRLVLVVSDWGFYRRATVLYITLESVEFEYKQHTTCQASRVFGEIFAITSEPIIRPWCIHSPSPSQEKYFHIDWVSNECRTSQKLVDTSICHGTAQCECIITIFVPCTYVTFAYRCCGEEPSTNPTQR